jgi:anti-sigma B factor antagonist
MNLKVEKRQLDNGDGVTVIELNGRVAIGEASRTIEPEVVKAINEGAKMVVIELTGVTYIDSTGVGIMSYCFGKAVQRGSDLRIAGAHDNVLNVFKVTRLVTVVPFYPDLTSALEGTGRLT